MPSSLILSLVLSLTSISALAQNRVDPSKFESDNVRFEKACAPSSDQIVIGGVGDLLMHGPLQKRAMQSGSFKPLWEPVLPVLQKSDILYANLETPLAEGVTRSLKQISNPGEFSAHGVYSSYPLFNTAPQMAMDLHQSQFSVLSTANNHSLDRGSIGADLTIEALREVGIKFTGTRHSDEPNAPWYTIVDKQGWRIAFVACTFSTNGIPDRKKQVLDCFKDSDELLKIVSGLAKTPRVDAVIVTPHWGWTEYVHSPDYQNVELGRKLIDAGATAVIGTHPHVIQPWEKYKAKDGREGLIVYSTGNFMSAQQQWQRRLGLSVYVGLSRNPSGKAWINGVRHHPLFMRHSPYQIESLGGAASMKHVWDLVGRMVGKDRYWDGNSPLITNEECRSPKVNSKIRVNI